MQYPRHDRVEHLERSPDIAQYFRWHGKADVARGCALQRGLEVVQVVVEGRFLGALAHAEIPHPLHHGPVSGKPHRHLPQHVGELVAAHHRVGEGDRLEHGHIHKPVGGALPGQGVPVHRVVVPVLLPDHEGRAGIGAERAHPVGEEKLGIVVVAHDGKVLLPRLDPYPHVHHVVRVFHAHAVHAALEPLVARPPRRNHQAFKADALAARCDADLLRRMVQRLRLGLERHLDSAPLDLSDEPADERR